MAATSRILFVERKDLEVRWRLAVIEHHHAWRAAHVVDVSVPQYRYRRIHGGGHLQLL